MIDEVSSEERGTMALVNTQYLNIPRTRKRDESVIPSYKKEEL